MTNAREILKNVQFLEGLSEHELESLVRRGYIKKFPQSEALFMQGIEGNHFFLLLSGTIKLFKGDSEGKETVIRIIKPGDIFAEIILYGNNKYPVSAQSIEASEVLAITKDSFLDLLDNKILRDRFLSTITERLKYLTNKVHFLSSFDIEERFFKFLHEHFGIQDEYIIKMQKKEIANTIGTIPETFSRLLKSLKKRELITWEKNRVTIHPSIWDRDIFK